MVHSGALCWGRAINMAQIRYMSRSDSIYWNSHFRRERRMLPMLGLFFPYHLQRCYSLTETAHGRLLVLIPPTYDRFLYAKGSLSSTNQCFRTNPVHFWMSWRPFYGWWRIRSASSEYEPHCCLQCAANIVCRTFRQK